MESLIPYILSFSFTILVACIMAFLASGLFLYLNIRRINQVMRHPYLNKYRWEQLPATMKLTITLDYFLRLTFPRAKWWVFGEANKLLAEVEPTEISMRLRWPVVGFWGGVFIGIVAMLVLWAMLLLAA
ncbi:hypothetical protein VRY85_08505 [Achromobacter sp. F4_2707]|uniref:hypothetical protein n=1 Tax=Achromobacter sp. F4_2707 TaxID=3114286 RepID=UPI0039C75549